jgi:hypothetical protein
MLCCWAGVALPEQVRRQPYLAQNGTAGGDVKVGNCLGEHRHAVAIGNGTA